MASGTNGRDPPGPNPMIALPFDISSTLIIETARTAGCLEYGLQMDVPKRAFLVCRAMAVIVTKTSRNGGDGLSSATQRFPIPNSSAVFANLTHSFMGFPGVMEIPNLNMCLHPSLVAR